MSRPAFTKQERELIGQHCATVIDNFECAGLAIEEDRERTLLSLDTAASALGTLVFKLKRSGHVPCAKCDRNDGRLGHAEGCPKGGQ